MTNQSLMQTNIQFINFEEASSLPESSRRSKPIKDNETLVIKSLMKQLGHNYDDILEEDEDNFNENENEHLHSNSHPNDTNKEIDKIFKFTFKHSNSDSHSNLQSDSHSNEKILNSKHGQKQRVEMKKFTKMPWTKAKMLI